MSVRNFRSNHTRQGPAQLGTGAACLTNRWPRAPKRSRRPMATLLVPRKTTAMTLFLDVSMLLRWSGPPVGILRVEAELARHAIKNRQDIDFVFFDARVNGFRRIARQVIEPLIEGRVGIDVTALPDARF